MDRRLEVMEQIITCERCELVDGCKSPVPFFGPTPCRVAVVGEAPGQQEDDQGRPFIGPAGQMIRSHLQELRIDPESLAWVNTVSCFPHGTPTVDHIDACEGNKKAQVQLIDPEFVLLLGKVPLFGQNRDVDAKRVRGHAFLVDGRVNMPTYHPAAALRNGSFEKAMHEDLETFKQLIDGAPWTSFISDKCAKCGAFQVWVDDQGLPWCESHAPKEYEERLAFLAADQAATRDRLHPRPPEQLAIS